MKYLILGNSAAAVAAVDAIRSVDASGEITMASPEADLAYGTPLISYVLKGDVAQDNINIRNIAWYEQNKVTQLFGAGKAAAKLDAKLKQVRLKDGSILNYDKLLVATGSVPSPASIKGLNDSAPNSFMFNNMDDTRAIMDYLKGELAHKRESGQRINVVISGSGLIGAKAAEGICEHVDKTYLVGHAKRPLRKLLDDEAAPILTYIMEKHGIVNVPSTVIESVTTDNMGKVVSATLSNGEVLDCDILITAIGVRPNVEILKAAGAKVERGAVCDEHMMTSLEDVYAAGDVANAHNVLLNEETPLALWPTASQQGKVAGLAMAGCKDAKFCGSFARNAVGFFHEIDILACGIINPSEIKNNEGIESVVYVDDAAHAYGKFNIREGKLVGYLLINRPDFAGIYTRIIRDEILLKDLPQDIFERDPQFLDLPKDLRDAAMFDECGAGEGSDACSKAANVGTADAAASSAQEKPSTQNLNNAQKGGASSDAN